MPDPAPTPTDPTTTDPAATPTPTTTPPPAQPEMAGPDAIRALERERAARRDAEKARKALETQLATLQQSSMSEAERAVAQARTEAATEAARQYGGQVVAAEIRAALAGRSGIDPESLVEAIDPVKFITDGTVDVEAIRTWVDKVAPAPKADTPPLPGFPDIGQGNRGGTQPASVHPIVADLNRKLGIGAA